MRIFTSHLKTVCTDSFPEENLPAHSPNHLSNSASLKNSDRLNPHSKKPSQDAHHERLVHPAACENALRDSHKRLLNIKILFIYF